MTCIVGGVDKKNNRVIIGGDSGSIDGHHTIVRKDKKVFENGGFVFGCTTSFRMAQLLQYTFKPPERLTDDFFEYMCTDFISGVRSVFIENGFMQMWESGQDKGGTFLVAYKDRLFKIDDDFQVAEAAYGFDACGSGEYYALGAIHAMGKAEAEDLVRAGLNSAAYFDASVEFPSVLIATK